MPFLPPNQERQSTEGNQSTDQSINIRLLRHDKMQANNSKQKDNTVSKKKAGLENKPKN